MQVTREQLMQFAQNNFYVLSHLSKLYYPESKCRPNRKVNWNKYTVDLIFSKSRYSRLCYSRYLLMYVMYRSGYIQTYISSLFYYTDASAWVGINLIIRYLNRYASGEEILLINELVADFKKEFNIVKKYSRSEA